MNIEHTIIDILEKHAHDYYPVVPLNVSTDRIVPLDLSKGNAAFTEAIYSNPENLVTYIENERKTNNATYLVGGYREHREMYRRSSLFDMNVAEEVFPSDEPRSLHLGIDIWGPEGTKISAPLGGMIHSFAFNNNFGDYGATIILQHQLDTINFYCLYGHLSLKDIESKRVGQFITRGENFAHFGSWEENGNWPPHLHFQVIIDMGNYTGDFPGVCKMSEAAKYLQNCPDPNLILKMRPWLKTIPM
ncbi:MAG: peptidoglycan DD-metalloendopeptidase family protein [Ferruginibacter sp.]|nr:peptidoglycan DD-metalloendopeptidase family protein [Ferruginibacter sp.]